MNRALGALGLAALAAVTIACSNPAPPSTSRSAPAPSSVARATTPASFPRLASAPLTNAPTPSSTVLFAVLEAKAPIIRKGPESGVADAYDTVAIVGLDGVARAKATFPPRSVPVVGNAAAWMGVPAVVAGGAVYYADGRGAINRLDVDGRVTPIASVPITSSQQLLTFAVSPNAKRVAATRVTFAPANPRPTGLNDIFLPGGHFTDETFLFDVGSAPVRIAITDSTDYVKGPAVVGWDRSGPLVATTPAFGTQAGTFGNRYFGSPVAHLAEDGSIGDRIGPDRCWTFAELPDQTVACGGGPSGGPAVYRANGDLDWSPECGNCFAVGVALSASGDKMVTSAGVFARDNSYAKALPQDCEFEGWLGEGAGVCRGFNSGQLSNVTFGGGTKLNDLGFAGVFVGAL